MFVIMIVSSFKVSQYIWLRKCAKTQNVPKCAKVVHLILLFFVFCFVVVVVVFCFFCFLLFCFFHKRQQLRLLL